MSDRLTLSQIDRISKLTRDQFPHVLKPFKPCAIYKPGLDMVQVLTRDCSVTAVSVIMNVLDILVFNDPENEKVDNVGFTFSPARQLCTEWGIIDGRGFVNLHHILDRLALRRADDAQGESIFTARQSLYELSDTRVRFD